MVYYFSGKSRTLLCTLFLVDPYGGYYVLPFMSQNHIIYIIPHNQLLFFDHSLFHRIFFFILSYLSYPWWSSSFEVDLPLFEALSFVMVSLTLGASDSCLLNCHHLFFGTSLILLLFQEVVQDLSYNSNAPVAWLELFHKTYAQRQILMHHAIV